MIVWGAGNATWGIPLLLLLFIAAGYPLRTRILGETWGFGAYLWHTVLSILGAFGFWIALVWIPLIVQGISSAVGGGRPVTIAVAVTVGVLMLAWEAWYPQIWLRAHAAEPLVSPELTPRFDEIVRRAGTITPSVFRVGPRGSRFVNAVALPSVRRPSVAMGTALLELLEPDETAAIFAHEVAHFDQFTPRVIRRRQLINRVLIVAGVAWPVIGLLGTTFKGVWIGWLWPILVLAALIRRTAKVQQHETESDLRAAALCGDPEALVRGLIKRPDSSALCSGCRAGGDTSEPRQAHPGDSRGRRRGSRAAWRRNNSKVDTCGQLGGPGRHACVLARRCDRRNRGRALSLTRRGVKLSSRELCRSR
jgi:Zn-dependent protease with chaperone function